MAVEASKTEPRYLSGSIPRHVLHLSSVMILGFLAMTLGNLIELYYIGQISINALAGIAFMFPIVMALNGFTRGIGIGASTLVAEAMGQSDRQRTARVVTHCYFLIICITLTIALLLSLTSAALLELIGAQGEALAASLAYSQIWYFGFPAMGMAMVSNGLIRAFGNPSFPGFIMTIAPIIQVTLGPVLIFGWLGVAPLGIKGAAWAFVMASIAQLLLAMYWYLIKARLFNFSAQAILSDCQQILAVGIPAAATNLIQPVSLAVITYLLATFGTEVIAGFGIASRIEAVVSMVVIGIATSVVPLVGQNFAGGRPDRVKQSLLVCYSACLTWGITAALIMWLGAELFVSAFNEAPAVQKVAIEYLHIVPLSIGFMGIMTVATHGFNALRRPMPALGLSVARLLLVYFPLALIGRVLLGYTGVFWATALANLVVGIAAALWLKAVLEQTPSTGFGITSKSETTPNVL